MLQALLAGVNDGFLKGFRDTGRFDTERYELGSSFRGWLKKIMIRTAIDYFRAHEKYHRQDDLADLPHEPADVGLSALEALAYDNLLRLVQQLPPAYRTVFNLFAIDGYTHDEIAQQLGITAGPSKSNLSKARAHLQHHLKNQPPCLRRLRRMRSLTPCFAGASSTTPSSRKTRPRGTAWTCCSMPTCASKPCAARCCACPGPKACC